MPCKSDYMDPTEREIQSKLVCELLVWLLSGLEIEIPQSVFEGSNSSYGNVDKVDHHTALLCASIKDLSESEEEVYLYNGRDAMSRKLADWWEDHQERDAIREAKERREILLEMYTEQAIEKLSPDELNALKGSIKNGKV